MRQQERAARRRRKENARYLAEMVGQGLMIIAAFTAFYYLLAIICP